MFEQNALSGVLVFSATADRDLLKPIHSPPPPLLGDTLAQNGFLDTIPDSLHLRFKEAIHHFITDTSATLAGNDAGKAAWPAAIPKLASNHRFVLEGIFALASLHLSQIVGSEQERKLHFNIAADRMNKGLQLYRTELQDVTEENSEALFTFSTTITAFILVTVGEECNELIQSIRRQDLTSGQRQETITRIVFAITRILRCLRGVMVILVPCWQQIRDGILSPIVTRDWWPDPIPTFPEAIEEDRRLRALESMWAKPKRKYEYYFDTLAAHLKSLRESFALVSQLTIRTGPSNEASAGRALSDWTSIITWPVKVSAEYISLLEQPVPDAWVILAHFAILPSRVKGLWWAKDLSSNLVSAAAFILDESEWSLIEWPATCAGVDLDSFRVIRSRT